MTCVSQASPLLSTLPYGVTAAAAVAIARFTGNDRGDVPSYDSVEEDEE